MRRVARIHTTNVNGTLTVTAEEYYVYNGANLVATLDKTGAVKQSYLYAGVDEPLRLKTNNGADLYFYEVDLAGNVRRVMGWAGSDQGGYRYSAFGILYAPDAQSPQAQIDQPLRWKGRPFSDFSGLYDMRARQWSPELGTFTSIDEHVFHDTSSTLWGWPNQNPLRFSDPSGREWSLDPNRWDDSTQQYILSGQAQADTVSFIVSAEVGLATGGLGGGALGGVGSGVLAGFIGSIAKQLVMSGGDVQCINFRSAAIAGLEAGAFGAIGGAVAGKMAGQLVKVTRWGRPGLQPGDWVMQGYATPVNYAWSGKFQFWGSNEAAAFTSGETFTVPQSSLQWPEGREMWKGILGQWIYRP